MKESLLCLSLFLFLLPAPLYCQIQRETLSVELGTAFNNRDLSWSIAGNLEGKSPNVLSELQFNNIHSLGYLLASSYTPHKNLRFSLRYQHNRVISGKGLDTDYDGDNRTNPTFNQSFESDKGHFRVLTTGVGIPISISSKVNVVPSVSYYMQEQKFYILDSQNQNLKSTYQMNLEGIKMTVDGTISLGKTYSSSLIFSWYAVDYRAEADWNLIDIFQHPLSFSHDSKGSGYEIRLVFSRKVFNNISVFAGGSLNTTSIQRGIDTTFLANGNEIITQFNGASSHLYGIQIGIRYHYIAN